MSVPEAAVNKYDCSVFWENNVRFSWQLRSMKPKSEAGTVKKSSER
jgi:hypothetical protein